MNEFGVTNPWLWRAKYNGLTAGVYKGFLRATSKGVRSYVFVATTGRSGSQSLSRIFEAVDGAVCYHEPHPVMGDTCPPGADRQHYFRNLFRLLKAPHVIRAARGHRCYVETNHQFIKHFADEALREFGDRLRVVHLRRDPVAVASSFYRIGSIPGRSGRGKTWLLDPEDPENLLALDGAIRGRSGEDQDFLRCLWYWYETEARVLDLRLREPGVRMPTLRTEDLNDAEALERFFAELDVPVDRVRLRAVTGVRLNTKRQEGDRRLEVSAAESMHAELREVIAETGGEFGAKLLRATSL